MIDLIHRELEDFEIQTVEDTKTSISYEVSPLENKSEKTKITYEMT